MSVERQCKKIP